MPEPKDPRRARWERRIAPPSLPICRVSVLTIAGKRYEPLQVTLHVLAPR